MENYDSKGGVKAIAKVQKAIREGAIKRIIECRCVDCGDPAERYDHRDYNKPLDVVPVCSSCNLIRGPALPLRGYFADVFDTGRRYYQRRLDMEKLFKQMGIEADLSYLPKMLKFEHWLPFKDVLLEWEARMNGQAI